jgi:hypothetical protein
MFDTYLKCFWMFIDQLFKCDLKYSFHLIIFLHVTWYYVGQTWCYKIIQVLKIQVILMQLSWNKQWLKTFKKQTNVTMQACEITIYCKFQIGIEILWTN